jgi:rfaE bifunctional protein kinase chain/domain
VDELRAALAAVAGQRVLVIGDLILDEYITGPATRISREAPVIIVEEQRRDWLLGGAAMPALNVICLGGQAGQVGVVGPDEAGRQVRQLLAEEGVAVEGVAVDPQRRTTLKTRIVAEGFLIFPQQVARVDRLDRQPLAPAVERALLDYLERAAPAARALLVSDYKIGVVTPGIIAGARYLAGRSGLLLTVDSQGDLDRFAGFDLVKCNHHDAAAFLGRPLEREEEVRAAIVEIQRRLAAPEVVITRAAAGLSFYSAAEGYGHLPAANRTEVFDVTGAGDAVIAVLTLARAAGASLRAACRLANLAAGVVIRKRGNQPITGAELAEAIGRWAGDGAEET